MTLSQFPTPRDRRYFEDYREGDVFEYGPITLTGHDIIDFAELSTAFTGSGPQSLAFPATLIDHDRDDDLDHADVNLFSFWLTGPGI